MYCSFCETPLGRLLLGEENGHLVCLRFSGEPLPERAELRETPLLQEASRQLQAYFSRKLKDFSLPLAPHGTPFQKAVWQALLDVPYGTTASYGEIAARVGNPKAARAVGMANNKNRIAIIIPCHRIIGNNGRLVGYGGGLDIKQRLLNLEAAG